MHYAKVRVTVGAFPEVKFIPFEFVYATSEVSYEIFVFFIDIEFVVYVMW